jgi:circadian clock protein KaiB
MAGTYSIEVVDILKDPQRAESEKILATPMLVRKKPPPVRRILGDLSDTERVLRGLDLPRQAVR